MSIVVMHGMHGLGDCLHQRAVIRHYIKQHTVYLYTPWPQVFHDLVGPRLFLLQPDSNLRTQRKNAMAKAGLYSSRPLPQGQHPQLRVWYEAATINRVGSVLGAMLEQTQVPAAAFDFTMPVPPAWAASAQALLDKWQPQKPVLVYRPLMQRTEWGGCDARNPDVVAYTALINSLREHYYVISIADLEPGKEWISGADIPADVKLHHGELEFETLAALISKAALVFCSPGFAAVLAQAVGTPSICVFGSYENGTSFSLGANFARHLAIDPVQPCNHFTHACKCNKAIRLPDALRRVKEFALVTTPTRTEEFVAVATPELVKHPSRLKAKILASRGNGNADWFSKIHQR